MSETPTRPDVEDKRDALLNEATPPIRQEIHGEWAPGNWEACPLCGQDKCRHTDEAKAEATTAKAQASRYERDFWEYAELVRERTAKWPAWKRAAAARGLATPKESDDDHT